MKKKSMDVSSEEEEAAEVAVAVVATVAVGEAQEAVAEATEAEDTAPMVNTVTTAGVAAMVSSLSVAMATITAHPSSTTTTDTTTLPVSKTYAHLPTLNVFAVISTATRETHGLGLSLVLLDFAVWDSAALSFIRVSWRHGDMGVALTRGRGQGAAGLTIAVVIMGRSEENVIVNRGKLRTTRWGCLLGS